MSKIIGSNVILRCYHCGNMTPHKLNSIHTSKLLYEQVEANRYFEPFEIYQMLCGTCNGLNLIGGFSHEILTKKLADMDRLYPSGSNLQPPSHQYTGVIPPVPINLVKLYDEVYFLKNDIPNAFANQIRRGLEFICEDKSAVGANLASKLNDLVAKGILPGHFNEITTLIRKVGNIGSHLSSKDVDIWDAELLDEFFRMVVEYVYIAPSKIERLKQRLNT